MTNRVTGDPKILYRQVHTCFNVFAFRFQRLKTETELDIRDSGVGSREGRKRTLESIEVEAWLNRYAEDNGDQAPDEEKIYLPSCSKKKDLYEDYVTDAESLQRKPVSIATLYAIWNQFCPKITIPKVCKHL